MHKSRLFAAGLAFGWASLACAEITSAQVQAVLDGMDYGGLVTAMVGIAAVLLPLAVVSVIIGYVRRQIR